MAEMSLLSGNVVNMDGSDDPSNRYTMPALAVKHEGSSKMKKSVILNLSDVSRKVGRPPEHLLTYLGQSLSARPVEGKEKPYIAGHHDPKVMQKQIIVFIQDYVRCHHCGNPETSCGLEGSKKNKTMFLKCKACSKRSDLDSTDRFVKHMLQHPPEDAIKGYGHAAGDNKESVMAGVAELADAELVEEGKGEKKKRQKCPNCGHKTSKAMCSKCGADVVKDSDGNAGSDGEGCHACIKEWMEDHKNGSFSPEWLVDFDSTVKSYNFQTPPGDQLAAVLEIMAADTIVECDLNAPKLQPVLVSKIAGPVVEKWSSLIGNLHSKIGDVPMSIDIMILSIKKALVDIPASDNTKESVMIGFLLSLQEHLDVVADDDIAAGCRRLQAQSKAMEKFIEFLESNEADDESDSD